MPPGPYLYPPDDLTDLPDRLLAAEIVREQIFLQTHEEVPYATTVETESFAERPDGSVRIEATVYVTRAGHKAILIGDGGARIREIGAKARQIWAAAGAPGAPVPEREGTRRLGRGGRPAARHRPGRPRLALPWSGTPPPSCSASPYGEGDALATLLTEEHGAHRGLARGGASRSQGWHLAARQPACRPAGSPGYPTNWARLRPNWCTPAPPWRWTTRCRSPCCPAPAPWPRAR